MAVRLGRAAPRAADPEAEALRRFRSFAATALIRGEDATPSLEGLRLNERRLSALLAAWTDAAVEIAAGRFDGELPKKLDPLSERFRLAVRSTGSGRRARGTPRTTRRAVAAAIDRVSDAFLAIDVDSGEIVDGNPAAGSLFGVKRDALLGLPAMSFIPNEHQDAWWTQLDALCEGDDNRRFRAPMLDTRGKPIHVDASITRFATRGRTLALLLMRATPSQADLERSGVQARPTVGGQGVGDEPGVASPAASPSLPRSGPSR